MRLASRAAFSMRIFDPRETNVADYNESGLLRHARLAPYDDVAYQRVYSCEPSRLLWPA